MTTICNLTMPAEEFGLAETLQAVPDTQVICEPVAASRPTESMPLIRIRALNRQELETALTSDTTVAEWTRLTGGESSWLYRIEWARRVSLIRRMLTGRGATILSAAGNGSEWSLRLLYPSRKACSQIYTVCENHNLSLTVVSIQTVDDEQSTRYGLTSAQHTALTQAYNMGYFKVPRDAGLDTVAETLDISHQALSERLRRAHQTLIGSTIGQQGVAQTTATAETVSTDGSVMSGGLRLPRD